MLASQRNSLIRRGQAIGAQLYPATLRFAGFDDLGAMRGNFSEQLDLVLGGNEAQISIAFSIDRALIPAGLSILAGKARFLWVEANKTLRVERIAGEGTPLLYLGCVDPNQS